MAANPTPTDLSHQVRVKTRSCALDEQRLMLRDAFDLASRRDRRVFVLGVNRRGRRVFCSSSACDHSDAPSVIPWLLEVEMQVNGWERPANAISLAPYARYDLPLAVAVGWHPAIWLPEWWMEEDGWV